ncbi:diaminopimelate decarboxylase [Mollicutes bacterium LVI A0078]|nr:diaminopimelate decarboxylase [Mollicutes bacterium LVI A0075]WOO91200.1 diaminopimelate decarboxylase [Mollicutes bacterium LVI A0078]
MRIDNIQIKQLIEKHGSPIYLYDKNQIIENIDTIKNISNNPNLAINYAVKANSNLNILKLIKEHGMKVDSTGYGEYIINRNAGFSDEDIYVVCNNLTKQELLLLANQNIRISADCIDQLKTLNEVAPGYQNVMLRVNPTFGAGENESIITGGDKHKFGIDIDDLMPCINYIKENNMKLVGINQHIGSLNLDYKTIVLAVTSLIDLINANNIIVDFINFGGGFGINYNHDTNNQLDFTSLRAELDVIFTDFLNTYPNKEVTLEFEPGRYIVANASILIGTVTSIKRRGNDIYIGTDLGFSQLARPTMYNSHHHISFITDNELRRECHVVGNMCENGDYLCKNRKLVIPDIGDLVIVHDTGAYGYSMASNFNNRLRPIEIMIDDQQHEVIRRRETIEDLLNSYK